MFTFAAPDKRRPVLVLSLGADPVHFHLSHGTAAGPLRPPPWSPAVYPLTVTPEAFARLAMGAVEFFATSLPPR